MVAWSRDAAWAILQGTVKWGMDRVEYAPETAVCMNCRHMNAGTVWESALHFATCPYFTGLWKAILRILTRMGLPVPIRKWFILYGPASVCPRRCRYVV
eukprot:SAG31_NODE_28291_length_412_cov_0.840256_1_plen_98_part_01